MYQITCVVEGSKIFMVASMLEKKNVELLQIRKLNNRFKLPEELSYKDVPLNVRRLEKQADIESAMEAVRVYLEKEVY